MAPLIWRRRFPIFKGKMSRSKVTASALPQGSLLEARRAPGDFLDCFSVASETPPRTAAEIITDFPGWAGALVALRNLIVAPFGLAKDGPDVPDKLGPFPVEAETEDEVIAGFDDKHLDFRVSVMSRGGRVYLATWVRQHNFGGRLYLRAILPFHVLIAREALARVARA